MLITEMYIIVVISPIFVSSNNYTKKILCWNNTKTIEGTFFHLINITAILCSWRSKIYISIYICSYLSCLWAHKYMYMNIALFYIIARWSIITYLFIYFKDKTESNQIISTRGRSNWKYIFLQEMPGCQGRANTVIFN